MVCILLVSLEWIRRLIIDYRYYIYEYERVEIMAGVKSVNENWDLWYLKLENGLEVVLVSDKESVKEGAAMNIEVGSCWENMEYSAGVAHLLEHMLF